MDEEGDMIVGVPLEDEAAQARLADLYAEVSECSLPLRSRREILTTGLGRGPETRGGDARPQASGRRGFAGEHFALCNRIERNALTGG